MESRPLSEVLALGARIVRELGLEPGVDTLGRWMAHHLAEVMLVAEKAKGPERQAAQDRAIDLILRLWSQRHDLPGGVHPLKQLGGVIAVLRRLHKDAWPYRQSNNGPVDTLLASAFDGLRLLVAHGVLLTSSAFPNRVELGEAAAFVEADEKFVIDRLNEWIEFVQSSESTRVPFVVVTSGEAADRRSIEKENEELMKLDPKIRAQRTLSRDIDNLLDTLEKLKVELGKSD